IDIEEIQQMLQEENDYNKTVKELLSLYKENESSDVINKMASLLGIYPDDNPKALYRYLVAKDSIPKEVWPEIRDNVANSQNLLIVITNILAKTFMPGYLLEFPATGSVMTQPRSRYYYRGENAYFRVSKASCFRIKDSSKPESIQAFIDRLRLYQCWE